MPRRRCGSSWRFSPERDRRGRAGPLGKGVQALRPWHGRRSPRAELSRGPRCPVPFSAEIRKENRRSAEKNRTGGNNPAGTAILHSNRLLWFGSAPSGRSGRGGVPRKNQPTIMSPNHSVSRPPRLGAHAAAAPCIARVLGVSASFCGPKGQGRVIASATYGQIDPGTGFPGRTVTTRRYRGPGEKLHTATVLAEWAGSNTVRGSRSFPKRVRGR